MRWSFLLSILAASLASANVLPVARNGEGQPPGPLIDRRSHVTLDAAALSLVRLEKRAPRAKCSAPVNPDGAEKRDLSAISRPGFSLVRRTMTLPGDDMNAFMQTEVGNRDWPIIWQTRGSDTATAGFDEFRDTAWSAGTPGLCGCTVLWIISRKAAYFAHYWENISFAPDDNFFGGDAEKAFERTVVKGLREGVGKGANVQQVSLKGQVDKLADDHVKAYLMRPAQAFDDREGAYRDKWDKIKQIVVELIPKLGEGERWKEITYDALDKDDPLLGSSARGHTLFKYDPDHEGKKKAMMWIEDKREPFHDDTWE